MQSNLAKLTNPNKLTPKELFERDVEKLVARALFVANDDPVAALNWQAEMCKPHLEAHAERVRDWEARVAMEHIKTPCPRYGIVLRRMIEAREALRRMALEKARGWG